MTVWVSPRGGARHDARVKVSITHGNTMDISNTAVVGVRPAPRLIPGGRSLDASDFQAVSKWISLNVDVLLDYWDGSIDAAQLASRLVKV